MNTHDVAPRSATIDRTGSGARAGPRPTIRRRSRGRRCCLGDRHAAACSPGASGVPTVPASLAVPSVDVSAGASLATGAAIAALDQIDAAIAANQSSDALTADDAKALQDLSTGIRTAVVSGDTTAARTAVENLSSKADEFAEQLNTPTGAQLKAAIEALKAALAAS